MGLRILSGIETFIINAGNPSGLRKEVEAIAFNHLDLDVTGPRVEIFRESTLEVLAPDSLEALTAPQPAVWSFFRVGERDAQTSCVPPTRIPQ